MKLRFAGSCRLCGTELPARTEAIYEWISKTLRCVQCPSIFDAPDTPTPGVEVAAMTPADSGAAGTSARREHERRRAKDDERLRERWGRFGGIAVALSDEKNSIKAWATGAVGEERGLGR